MPITRKPAKDFREKIDFGIITIRIDEYQALLQRLPTEFFLEGHQTYSVSRLKTVGDKEYLIALVRCPEQGNTASQATANSLIDDLDPKWIILAGIAGGVPGSEFTLGDVLVATRLKDFSVAAYIEESQGKLLHEFDTRGGPMHPSVLSLVAAIPAIEPKLERWNTSDEISVERPSLKIQPRNLYGDRAWKNRVKVSLDKFFGSSSSRRQPMVFTGSVASSDILVKNTELIKQWTTESRHLDGIEMELTGVYQAAWKVQKPVLAVRGISDIVGFKRSPEWTAYACHTAASFLVNLLKGYPPFDPISSQNVEGKSYESSAIDSKLSLPIYTDKAHHYTARALPLLGREVEFDILRRFASLEPNFKWMQIAGAGGQGKSRLALELALELQEEGWTAGFLQTGDLLELNSSPSSWRPQKPTLIITDYVIGFENELGKAIADFSKIDNVDFPLRWLILERQRWDRGYLEFEPAEKHRENESGTAGSSPNPTFAGVTADWFSRLSGFKEGQGSHIDGAKFEPSVIELRALEESQLITIVKRWCAKNSTKIIYDDDELKEILARIDPTGRPLYAYFLAEALSSNFSVKGWNREDLLRATLSRDQRNRWKQYFPGSPPTLGDDVPALRLSLLATFIGSLDVRALKNFSGWNVPDSTIRRQALALVDGPIGSDVSGPREFIPKLEPDILGGWFILDIAAHEVIEINEILEVSWKLSPRETAATLLRLAQDFPRNEKLLDLLKVDPPTEPARQAYADIALELLVAIRDKERVRKINLIPKIEVAAALGNNFAMAQLGLSYRYGIGVDEPDLKKAFYWFDKGARAGNFRAMTYLGHCYFSGAGVAERDPIAAFSWFLKGAEGGDANAMTYVGICYQVGIGVEKNFKKAVHWFSKGAEAGDGLGMVYLGLILLTDDGIDKDLERAFLNFKRGAEAGSAHAMAYLGHCFENGLGVEKNILRAVDWYRKGADAGSGHAMACLGLCYLNGVGVEKADESLAIKLFKDGIQAGSGLAMTRLGNSYEKGRGVQQNEEEAVKWWIEAAKLNDEEAIKTLQLKNIVWR